MGKYAKGEFGTYAVTGELAGRDPGLTEGEELVFLPTNVDEAGAASGIAFTADGRSVPVVIPAEEPEAEFPTSNPAGVPSEEWQAFQKFRADAKDRADAPQEVPKSPSPTEDGPATSTTPVPAEVTPAAQESAEGETSLDLHKEGNVQ